MTKPTRTEPISPECPPIRGPQPHRKVAVTESRANHTRNLAAFCLASGKTVAESTKDLNLHVDKVRALFTDPEVISVADELAAHMKDYFAQRSQEFIAKIIDSMELQYNTLKDEMIPCITKLTDLRDSDESGPSAQIAAVKELKSWFEAIAKAIMHNKDEQTGTVFVVPMKDLSKLIAQDTGKIIDVTPSANGEAQ